MRLLYTCDCMVEGVHFLATANPADVGYKLMAGNISDIAAMGGKPLYALVTLVLPGETDVNWVLELYQGLAQCAEPLGVAVVGGDISQGPVIALNVCLLGEVVPGQEMLRSTARPGDLVVVTGALGDALAGLEVVLQEICLETVLQNEVLGRHYRPLPRVREGQLMAGRGCRCANDISDGLASEAWEIAQKSNVSLVIYSDEVPVAAGAQAAAAVRGRDPLYYALYSGEEYELLLCLDSKVWQEVKTHLPQARVIGEVVAGQGVYLRTATGLSEVGRGWEHFGG
jgi:thiamine-monophosphate kinase